MAEDKTEGSGRRLILLLRVIAGLEAEFTLKELTARSGLPTTSVHRLLQVLIETGMVERADGQSYRPGAELLRLASMVLRDFDVHRAAKPFVEELWLQWQETVSFAVYRPQTHTAMVVDTIPTPHPLRYVIERFTEISLPWGSLGRSILAHLPQQEMEAVVALRTKGPLSGRSPPSEAQILEELAVIRRKGVAVYQDTSVDFAGVAAPVFGLNRKVVGCIGVTMPPSRFGQIDQEALCAAVSDGARRLSAAIGGDPADEAASIRTPAPIKPAGKTRRGAAGV